MSNLASVMQVEQRAERARALKHLLAHPITLAAAAPEIFRAILRHREWLVSWFADHPGWTLFVDPHGGFARLHKVPANPDSTRGASASGRAEFDRRRYTVFCLALAAFDELGAQTTLVTLAKHVEELAAEDQQLPPFDPTSGSERRAFVEALRLLVELGVLRVREGDADRYAQTRDSDALFDIDERLLSHLISAPVPPAFAGTPERLLEEVFPETDEGQRLRHRQHALRRLLDDPVLYFEDLEPAAFDWVDHSRGWLYRLLQDDAGFAVERRAEGLAVIDTEGITADTSFPDGGSTAKHAAILLAEQLVKRHKKGTDLLSTQEGVALTRLLHQDYGERCRWSHQYPLDDDGCERLTREAMRLLEAFGLVLPVEDGWRARPAIARFRPGTPTRRSP